MRYTAEFPVRFGDIDRAGVIYYPQFFHYFHQTFEDWFGDALGVPYSDVVVGRGLGFPSVRVETDFLAPLRYGDRVRVELTLADIGSKSITVQYVATRAADGVRVAVARIVKVAVENESFRSVPIPDDLRERFQRFRAGEEGAPEQKQK